AVFLLACSLSPLVAQSTSSFPAHCLPRREGDPVLDQNACAKALNYFSSDHYGLFLFTNNEKPEAGTIKLPWERTDRGCRVRVEMLYANESEEPVHDVWDQGMTLNSKCVIHSDSIGGRIFVNEAGLTVSVRPGGDDHDWEERFNKDSVVAGSDVDSDVGASLGQITARSN
ncbi:MAG: hypothetical protein Q9226_006510, partial [Calogaya cf. arnoldii]